MSRFWCGVLGLACLVFNEVSLSAVDTSRAGDFQFSYDASQWETVSVPSQSKENVDKEMFEKTLATLQFRQSEDKYHSRFSVVLDSPKHLNLKGEDALNVYAKHASAFLKSQRFTILDANPVKLKNISEPAIDIRAHQRDFGLTFRQVIFVRNGSAYLLTGAARTASFEKHNNDFQAFLDTFITQPK